MSTNKSTRMHELLDLLAERGRLSVSEGASALGVSEATVRRDFTSLADQQLVTRTHGGVVASSVAYDLPVRYRNSGGQQGDGKERIASTAAALVMPGQSVGFNGGTTTSATARLLAARPDLVTTREPRLTVVTNALNIAAEMVLRPHVRTVSVGGVARPQSYEVVGPLAQMVLRELWLDHLFLGVEGITEADGPSCFHDGEASINGLMVQRAREVTVITMSHKLGKRSFARICDVNDIDRLVTDTGADPTLVAGFEARGVEVVLV